MSYELLILPDAVAELKAIPVNFRRQISKKMEGLKVNPNPSQSKPLAGEFKGLFRLRSGDYRVVYTIDHQAKKVTVLKVADRRDVYE